MFSVDGQREDIKRDVTCPDFCNNQFLTVHYDDFVWLLNREDRITDGRSGALNASSLVWSALSQAQQSHGSQMRQSGGDYFSGHVLPVATSYILHERLVGERVQAKGVSAALTHDTPEDDDMMTGLRFEDRFGSRATYGKGERVKPDRTVAIIVELLTNKNPALFGGDETAAKKAYLNQLFSDPTPPITRSTNPALEGVIPDAIAVEIARKIKAHDRAHNVFTFQGKPDPESINRKIEETIDDYLVPIERVSPILAESITERLQLLKEWMESGRRSDRFFAAIPEWWWQADSEFCHRIAGYNLMVGFQFRTIR